MTLCFVLSHKWFDLMCGGSKDVEYREITPYWGRRIWDKRHLITRVRFSRGYTRRTILREVKRIDTGPCPHEGWNKGSYYRIHLGPILELREE